MSSGNGEEVIGKKQISLCIFCDKPLFDYEPEYCCNGYMCGCMGLPIYPPIHEECVIIKFLSDIKKMSEQEPNFVLGMAFNGDKSPKVDFECKLNGEELKLSNPPRQICEYLMDSMSMISGLKEHIPLLIKLLEDKRDKTISNDVNSIMPDNLNK